MTRVHQNTQSRTGKVALATFAPRQIDGRCSDSNSEFVLEKPFLVVLDTIKEGNPGR